MSMEKKIQLRLEYVKSAKKYGLNETARIFGISFNTVHKWSKRYEKNGIDGLQNLPKTNFTHPNEMPQNIVDQIIELKKRNHSIKIGEIKKKLNLKYDYKIIKKKLLNANLLIPKDKKIDFDNFEIFMQEVDRKNSQLKFQENLKCLENIIIKLRIKINKSIELDICLHRIKLAYFKKSEILIQLGHISKAEKNYLKVIKLFNKYKMNELAIDCYIKISDLNMQNDYNKSFEMLNIAKNLVLKYPETTSLDTNFQINISFGNLHFNNLENNESFTHYKKAYEISLLEKNTYNESIAKIGMANVFVRMGLHNKTRVLIDEVEEIANRENDFSIIYKIYIGNADLYINIHDFPFKYEKEIVRYIKKIDNYRDLLKTYEKLGLINFRKDNLTEALNYFKKGLLLASKTENKINMALFLLNIASVYLQGEQNNKANLYLKKVLKITSKRGFEHLNLVALSNLGIVLLRKEKYKNAEINFNKLISSSKRSKYKSIYTSALYNLSLVQYNIGKYEHAQNNLRKVIPLCRKYRESFKLARAYNLSALTLKNSNKPKSVIRNFNSAIEVSQDFKDKTFLKEILENKLKFLTENNRINEADEIRNIVKITN